MIPFFRNIRNLPAGKAGRYLRYAIGEIVLVVIGILIALSINNWNENRKRYQAEKHYLSELKIEFSSNLNALKRVMNYNTSNGDNALKLTNYSASDSMVISESEFNNLLFNSIIGEVQYRPSPGTLNEILNGGKLEIISNKRLRSKLSSWEGILLKVRFQEQEHAIPRLKLLDIVYTEGNFRDGFLDTEFTNFNLKPRNASTSNIQLLNNQEFDNLLSVFYLTGKYLNKNYYNDLKLYIEEILDLIDEELKP